MASPTERLTAAPPEWGAGCVGVLRKGATGNSLTPDLTLIGLRPHISLA